MRRCLLAFVLFIPLLGASSDTFADSKVNETTAQVMPLSSPRGGFVVMPESMSPEPLAIASAIPGGEPTLIYMNRRGGVFTPGNNDSRTNRSFLTQQTASIPAWNTSDADWDTVMECVRDQFSRFNVEITDSDPGNVPHIESVVGGVSGDIGINAQGDGVILGVSPFTSNCGFIDNSIVFTFAGSVTQSNPQLICEVATQEIAHSFGLDHQHLCEDPMSYLTGCGAKSFQNRASSCGEFEARSCKIEGQYDCGRDTQNSVALLTERLGLAPDAVPPSATIVSPLAGTQVPQGFRVDVDASDDKGIVSASLLIDGVVVDENSVAPYTLTAPLDIAVGQHDIEVVVTDYTNDVSKQVRVEVVQGASQSGSADVTGGCQASHAGPERALTVLLGLIFACVGFGRRKNKSF